MSRRRKSSHPFSLFAFQDIITSVTGILILITLLIAMELVNSHEQTPQNQTTRLNKSIQQQLLESQHALSQLDEQLHGQPRNLNRDAILSPDTLKSNLQALKDRMQQIEQKNRALARQLTETKRNHQKIEQVRVERSNEATKLKNNREKLIEKSEELNGLTTSDRLIYNVASNENSTKTPWLIEITGSSVRVARMGKHAPPIDFDNEKGFEEWAKTLSSSSSYFFVLFRPGSVDSYRTVLDFIEKQGITYGYDLIDKNKVVIDPKSGAGI